MRATTIKTNNLQFDKIVKELGDRLGIDADARLVSSKRSLFRRIDTYKFIVTFAKKGWGNMDDRVNSEASFNTLLKEVSGW